MSELIHELDASSEQGPQNLRDTFRAHCCSLRPNHSAMTHPSKTNWHQLSGITHWLHQRVDFTHILCLILYNVYMSISFNSIDLLHHVDNSMLLYLHCPSFYDKPDGDKQNVMNSMKWITKTRKQVSRPWNCCYKYIQLWIPQYNLHLNRI